MIPLTPRTTTTSLVFDGSNGSLGFARFEIDGAWGVVGPTHEVVKDAADFAVDDNAGVGALALAARDALGGALTARSSEVTLVVAEETVEAIVGAVGVAA